MKICEKIYDDHKVYLLNAVLVERELLKNLLKNAQNRFEVDDVLARFKGRPVDNAY